MKNILVVICLFYSLLGNTQNEINVVGNEIFNKSQNKIAIISKTKNNRNIITYPYINTSYRYSKYIKKLYPKSQEKINIYAFKQEIFFEEPILIINERRVGAYGYKIDSISNTIKITIIIEQRNIATQYVKYYLNKKFNNYDKIKSSFTFNFQMGDKIRLEEERRIIEEAISAEKQRIERFYAQVFNRLDGDLDNIEGIYKSVDLGEGFEYDIAIFKSYANNREYVGLILQTTDTDLSIGGKIFTFEKTAQKNLFFGKYISKDGTAYENKTASLSGAILKMGVKSFIKMFPAEGETRQYREINPLVDWESSGSGVLINNKGFIATNNHVIKGAKKIRISFQNDSVDYIANIISQNEENDVAIIQITDSRFKSAVNPVKWNSSVSLGEKVFTLGYPISNKMSDNVKVVDGIVSGLNGIEGNKSFFQTTLPVWYGNSGGPCFNSRGEILGLATQILWDKGEKVDNVAYVTRTSNVLSLSNSIILSENISKAGLNEIELQDLIKKLIPYSAFIKVNY